MSDYIQCAQQLSEIIRSTKSSVADCSLNKVNASLYTHENK